jgi:hypothetical protein
LWGEKTLEKEQADMDDMRLRLKKRLAFKCSYSFSMGKKRLQEKQKINTAISSVIIQKKTIGTPRGSRFY